MVERLADVYRNVLADRQSEDFLAVDQCGQIHKGVWGMSWRQKAMKGVEGCEKSGGAVKQALIPESLNYCMMNP